MADSLRVQAGVAYDDSLALADAFTTLRRVRLFYPDDYARACYYYGRLLRTRGDQVAAMQAFICGTHAPYIHRITPLPHFSDYHILGRIYSNIGIMCQLANNHQLGYIVYRQSAEAFHVAYDSTAYFYAVNSMALQLAEQNRYAETLNLLQMIQRECTNVDVINKTLETSAILYENVANYDSAIYFVEVLYSREYVYPTGYVIKAQAFWHLQQYDSALYYAQIVMSHPLASAQDKYNMMYILTYNDSTIDADEIKKRSEERADIDKEILDPLHEQLAHSMEVLQQDMDQKPDWTWLFVVMSTMGIVISVYFGTRKRRSIRKQELCQQELACKEKIQQLQHQQNLHQKNRLMDIESQCAQLRSVKNLKRALHLSDYNAMKQMINMRFNRLMDKLEANTTLTHREIQFCVLVLINIPQKQIAELLVYSETSIKTTKANIAKKMKTSSADLRNHLINMALG